MTRDDEEAGVARTVAGDHCRGAGDPGTSVTAEGQTGVGREKHFRAITGRVYRSRK